MKPVIFLSLVAWSTMTCCLGGQEEAQELFAPLTVEAESTLQIPSRWRDTQERDALQQQLFAIASLNPKEVKSVRLLDPSAFNPFARVVEIVRDAPVVALKAEERDLPSNQEVYSRLGGERIGAVIRGNDPKMARIVIDNCIFQVTDEIRFPDGRGNYRRPFPKFRVILSGIQDAKLVVSFPDKQQAGSDFSYDIPLPRFFQRHSAGAASMEENP